MTALFFELSRRSRSKRVLSTCGLQAMMLRCPIRSYGSQPSLRRFHKPPESGCQTPAAPIPDAQRKPGSWRYLDVGRANYLPGRLHGRCQRESCACSNPRIQRSSSRRRRWLENKTRSVRDELTVYSENRTESTRNLGRGIVIHLQRAHGQVDQHSECGDVRQDRAANVK
jgi:hypothetical protein